jgi:hypothetical protein
VASHRRSSEVSVDRTQHSRLLVVMRLFLSCDETSCVDVSPRSRGRLARAAVVLATVLTLCAGFAAGPAAPSVHAVAKGLIDRRLETATSAVDQAALIKQIGPQLGARWVRLTVDWQLLEPTRGVYDAARVKRLDELVDGLHARHIKVILTTCYLPAWATDKSWWTHPPTGYPEGYQPFYPIRTGALSDYARLGEYLARHFKGRVQALECWNEPNLWPYVYPQRTPDDPFFAARTYLRMLRAFHTGVKRAHTSVKVVGGATAPVGLNDRYRTSPQRFAGFLKRHGAARLFDVYSHHPYTPGGSIYSAPEQPPNNPRTTVTLYNLRTLLRLFPSKPFFLTEYGYNTHPSQKFGGFTVSDAVQARYLRRAYRYAASYRQVKLLLWFRLYDSRPVSGPADGGVYSGLREADGARKPAWYAFAHLGR